MIDAGIYTQSDGKIVGFVLRGHSDRGDARGHGYNVRCAEVAMLSQTVYLGIREYLNRDAAAENNEHGGLGFELKNAPDDSTEAVFQIMLIGLREIENVAPNVVKIKMIQMNAAAEANLQSKLNSMTPTPPKPLPKVNVEDFAIRADFYRDDDGNTLGFSVEECDIGKVDELNIYYAGVWALTKAVVACVKDYLKRDANFATEDRRLAIKLKTPPDEVTEAVFQTMLIGLREIEKQAPQIICVNEKIPRR